MGRARALDGPNTADGQGAGFGAGQYSPPVEAWFKTHPRIDNLAFKQLESMPGAQRDAIVHAMQQQYGNSFVQLGLSGKLPESTDTKAPTDPYERATWDYDRCVELDPPNSQRLWRNLLGHMELAINRTPLYLAQMLASVPAAAQAGFVGYVRQHDPTLLAEAQRDAAQVDQAEQDFDHVKKVDPKGYVVAVAQSIDGVQGGQSLAYQEEMLERLKRSGQLVNAGNQDLNLARAIVPAEQDGVINAPAVTQIAQNQGQYGFNSSFGAANELAIVKGRIAPLQAALDAANKRVADLDQMLAVEIAQVGATLTLEQQAAYVAKFRALNKYTDAVNAVPKAASALNAELVKDSATLQTFGDKAGDAGARTLATTTLVNVHRSLAVSSREGALVAIIWADSMLAQTASAAADVAQFNQIASLAEQTLLTSLARDLKALLRRDPENTDKKDKKETFPAQVREAVLTIQKNYVDPVVGIKHIKDLQDVPALVKTFGAFAKARWSDGMTDEAVLEVIDDVFKEHAFAPSFAGRVANILFNGVSMTSISAAGVVSDSAREAFRRGAQNLVDMAGELSREAKKLPVNTREYTALAHMLGAKGDALSRLLPSVGLTVSLGATAHDWMELQNGKDPSKIAMFAGDAICTLGGILEMTDVFAPLGVALNVIGEAIDVIAILLPHGPTEQQSDETQILGGKHADGTSGIDAYSPALISIFTTAAGGDNANAAGARGMTPAQIQDLATRWPFLFTRDGTIAELAAMKDFLEAGFDVENFKTHKPSHHRLTSVASVSSPVPLCLFVEKSVPGLEGIINSIDLSDLRRQWVKATAVSHWLGGVVTGISSQPPQPGFGFDSEKSYAGPSIGPAT